MKFSEHWCDPVTDYGKIIVFGTSALRQDKWVEARKADTLVIQKASESYPGKIIILDFPCPWNEHMAQKDEEHMPSYQPLISLELERTQRGKSELIPNTSLWTSFPLRRPVSA